MELYVTTYIYFKKAAKPFCSCQVVNYTLHNPGLQFTEGLLLSAAPFWSELIVLPDITQLAWKWTFLFYFYCRDLMSMLFIFCKYFECFSTYWVLFIFCWLLAGTISVQLRIVKKYIYCSLFLLVFGWLSHNETDYLCKCVSTNILYKY